MQLYQIFFWSEINGVVHGTILFRYHCTVSSVLWIDSVSRLGQDPYNARKTLRTLQQRLNIVSLHLKKATHKISQDLMALWWRYQRLKSAIFCSVFWVAGAACWPNRWTKTLPVCCIQHDSCRHTTGHTARRFQTAPGDMKKLRFLIN